MLFCHKIHDKHKKFEQIEIPQIEENDIQWFFIMTSAFLEVDSSSRHCSIVHFKSRYDYVAYTFVYIFQIAIYQRCSIEN